MYVFLLSVDNVIIPFCLSKTVETAATKLTTEAKITLANSTMRGIKPYFM